MNREEYIIYLDKLLKELNSKYYGEYHGNKGTYFRQKEALIEGLTKQVKEELQKVIKDMCPVRFSDIKNLSFGRISYNENNRELP